MFNCGDTESLIARSDSHDEAVPPLWFITPGLLLEESGKLQSRTNVPLSNIALVTPRTVNSITKNSKRVDLRRLENDLKSMVKEWTSLGSVPEVDWSRIRLLELQDLLRDRATLINKVEQNTCLTCPEFPMHVRSWNPLSFSSVNFRVVFPGS
jgi:antiviral helicase SKI2